MAALSANSSPETSGGVSAQFIIHDDDELVDKSKSSTREAGSVVPARDSRLLS